MGLQLSPVQKRCVALVASSWVPSEVGRRFESPQLAYFLYVMHFAWHCTRMHFVCRGGCSCARVLAVGGNILAAGLHAVRDVRKMNWWTTLLLGGEGWQERDGWRASDGRRAGYMWR